MEKDKELGIVFKAMSHLLHNQELLMREVCKDKIYTINDTNELSVLLSNLSEAYYNNKEKEFSIVDHLKNLKEEYPEKEIIVSTSEGTVSFKLKDAFIYEGTSGEIVLDSE